jgi:xanthine dehydrogenase small subunit
MRDHVLLYVNGTRHEIRGPAAFASLTDFLRSELRLTGTKVVCAEGDCGACTVLVGKVEQNALRYEPVDACIQFLYQLDSKHVLTVEGLPGCGDELHPVQQAIIDGHGSQCGFCTPGFVMALAGYFDRQTRPERESLQTALTGNLCRCTGYLPILEAARSVPHGALPPLNNGTWPEAMLADLTARAAEPIHLQTPTRTFFAPRRLEDALDIKARHPEAIIVSGGTELGVLRNKSGFDPSTLLSLTRLERETGVFSLEMDDPPASVSIGANVTWLQLEEFARARLPEFYKLILRFGSPQIRNVSTLVGNVAHGSPIADSLPFLCVMDAEVELLSRSGSRRVSINRFYKGYKVKDLRPEEIIIRIRLPLPAPGELLKLYKVSRRNDLDIATFGAAIRVRRSGEIISRAKVAYAGVAPTIVRLPATEAFLQGKRLSEETFREAGRLAQSELAPITDVRGSRDFRLLLARNILLKFYTDCQTETLQPVA